MKIVKKIMTAIVVTMLMIFNSTAFAIENVTGTVNTDSLNLREEASTDSAVLDLLAKDDKVEVLEEKDGWYKVKFKDYTGFVSKEFITVSGEVKKADSNIEKPNNNVITGTVQIDQKNVKLAQDAKLNILPLINSNVIFNLSKDTNLTVISNAGGWAYVKYQDTCGWVRLDKLVVIEEQNQEQPKEEVAPEIKEDDKKEEEKPQVQENDNKEDQDSNKVETNQVEVKQEEVSQDTAIDEKTAYIKELFVNIRSKATTDSEVVITLEQNTEVNLVAQNGDWYKVEVYGKTGYVLGSLVSDNKVEVTSRSSVPERTTTSQETNTEVTNNEESEESQAVQQSTSKGEEVVAYAKQFLGCPYVWAGAGPYEFDCSGFTMFVYSHFGFYMGHSAVTQSYVGEYVPRSELQPGDLIIINNESNTSIGHVGMYVGGGNFIHASSGSGEVVISPLSNPYYNARYVTARRIFN